jgi:hypothetical protein
MVPRRRTILLVAFVAAVVVFCIVQDRVTASGARQYVAMQRAALAGQGQPVTLDGVMRPAVRQSVRQAALWSGVVMIGGIIAAAGISRP